MTILQAISSDIVVFSPTDKGRPIVGKKELKAHWFPSSSISYPVLSYIIEKEDIGVSDSLAYYQGLSKMTWCTKENNVMKDTTTSISDFTNILKLEDGKWKLYRIMYNLKDASYSR